MKYFRLNQNIFLLKKKEYLKSYIKILHTIFNLFYSHSELILLISDKIKNFLKIKTGLLS